MPTATATITTALALLTTATLTTTLYLRHRHRTLRAQVTTRTLTSPAALPSLPAALTANPSAYHAIHTQDTIPLSAPTTTHLLHPSNAPPAQNLFTQLLQRNMHAFARRAPQSYALRLLARTPEQRRSFSHHHISRLQFAEGDLACGVYRVLARDPTRCEMGMDATTTGTPARGLPPSFGGRLVTALILPGDGEGGEGVLRTETLQWVSLADARAGFALPLERRAMRWLHELASWGLLVQGRDWVEGEVRRLEGREGEG